jgi:putative ABC transport system permease protein
VPATGPRRAGYPAAELRGGASDGPSQSRLRASLASIQVAMAVVALVGAGLFMRSMSRVLAIEPGLDLERVATVTVDVRRIGLSPAEERALMEQAVERVARLPGVASASLASQPPLMGFGFGYGLTLPDGSSLPAAQEGPYFAAVGDDYFRTLGIALRSGRAFQADDRTGARPVIVVNESMARLIAPGGPPLGRCLRIMTEPCAEIVGVVADNLHRLFDERPVPYVFRPLTPDAPPPLAAAWILVRTRGPVDPNLAEIRAAVQSLDRRLPYVRVQRLTELVRDDVLPYQVGAYLSSAYGLLALLITAVGLYGLLAYLIAQRTVEIAIRRALGASNLQVARIVVSGAAWPVAVGGLVGLAAALAGGRIVASLLYSTAPRDLPSLAAAGGLVLLIAAAAAYLPARRALRVDPSVALRGD